MSAEFPSRIRGIDLGRNEKPLELFKKPSTIVTKETAPQLAEARGQLLEWYKTVEVQRQEGLDIKRVHDFLGNLGLIYDTQLIIFSDEDVSIIAEILTNCSLSNFGTFDDPSYSGELIPELNLAVVRRGKETKNIEDKNGALYTEGLCVHEMLHGATVGKYTTCCYTDNEDEMVVFTPRVGFSAPDSEYIGGMFLEEGMADLLRMQYTVSNISSNQKKKLLATQYEGEDLTDLNSGIKINAGDNLIYSRPYKYYRLNSEGKREKINYGDAAFGLELLFKKDPSLLPIMIEARSDVGAYKQMIKKINDLMPGGYATLRAAKSFPDFSQCLKKILLAVGEDCIVKK